MSSPFKTWQRKIRKRRRKGDYMHRVFALQQDYWWMAMCSSHDPEMMRIYSQKESKWFKELWRLYDIIYKKNEEKNNRS